MKTINQIAQEIQNVQIYPSTTRVEPNDKVTKLTFNFNAETYEELITGDGFGVIETKRHKKFGEITSSFKIRSIYNEPLTEFDRAVLAVCTSEMCAGNLYTTPNIIYRGLTGKIGEVAAIPYANQLSAILHSVNKLMGTKYTSKIADAFKILGYGDGDFVIKDSMILPAVIVDITVNGQRVENAIYFDRESPLWILADAKSQVIRYDANLLNVPNQQNTPMNIMLKNYVCRRVHEIKLHKQMTPTVTLEDIFRKTRISDASRKTKMDARNTVKTFFEHLQTRGAVKSFEFVKRGNQIHAVKFTF